MNHYHSIIIIYHLPGTTGTIINLLHLGYAFGFALLFSIARSCGCVAAELVLRQPLFPGRGEFDMLQKAQGGRAEVHGGFPLLVGKTMGKPWDVLWSTVVKPVVNHGGEPTNT